METNLQLERLEKVAHHLKSHQQSLNFHIENLDKYKKEIFSLKQEIKILSKVLEVLRLLLDKVNMESISKIESLTSQALRAVFNEMLTFKIDVSYPTRGVNYKFYLRDDYKQIEGDISNAFGGSVAQVAGHVIRFVYVLTSQEKLPRVLLIDEGFGAIETECLERFIQLLNSMCDQFNFNILTITHRPEVIGLAKNSKHLISKGNYVEWKNNEC